MARTKQPWELAAEKLVDDVRWLLGYRQAIVTALGESPGRDEVQSRLREMHALVTALEVELARAATADDRAAVGSIATLLKKGIGHVTMFTLGLVATDVHDALIAVDNRADQVIECVIEVRDLVVDDVRQEQTASEVTIEPATLRLRPGDVTVMPGDAPSDATVRPETIQARADVHTPRVVTGQASADLGFEATAGGQSRTIGTVVEHDEALPITPVRGASGSRIVSPPRRGRPVSADVIGDVAATADDDVATAQGTALPPTIEATDGDVDGALDR